MVYHSAPSNRGHIRTKPSLLSNTKPLFPLCPVKQQRNSALRSPAKGFAPIGGFFCGASGAHQGSGKSREANRRFVLFGAFLWFVSCRVARNEHPLPTLRNQRKTKPKQNTRSPYRYQKFFTRSDTQIRPYGHGVSESTRAHTQCRPPPMIQYENRQKLTPFFIKFRHSFPPLIS